MKFNLGNEIKFTAYFLNRWALILINIIYKIYIDIRLIDNRNRKKDKPNRFELFLKLFIHLKNGDISKGFFENINFLKNL